MSRYNWNSLPEWINYAFTDQDGDIFGCDNMPCTREGFHGHPNDKWEYLGNKPVSDWQDSLEGRNQ